MSNALPSDVCMSDVAVASCEQKRLSCTVAPSVATRCNLPLTWRMGHAKLREHIPYCAMDIPAQNGFDWAPSVTRKRYAAGKAQSGFPLL